MNDTQEKLKKEGVVEQWGEGIKFLISLSHDRQKHRRIFAVNTLKQKNLSEKDYNLLAMANNRIVRMIAAEKSKNVWLLSKLFHDRNTEVAKLANQNICSFKDFSMHAKSIYEEIREIAARSTTDGSVLLYLSNDGNGKIADIAKQRYCRLTIGLSALQESMEVTLEKRGGIYSLWIDSCPNMGWIGNVLWQKKSPVYCCGRNMEFEYIMTTNKLKGHKIQKTHLSFLEKAKIKEGDYCNADGIALPSRLVKSVNDIFNQVRTGTCILPPGDNTDYDTWVERIKKKIKRKEDSENREIKYRTWGQKYLSSLNPDRVEQGELLGSGGSYLAYYFTNRAGIKKVVVEFDQENVATYKFDAESFSSLRLEGRMDLRKTKPNGFDGIIVHYEKNGRENWKKSIEKYID